VIIANANYNVPGNNTDPLIGSYATGGSPQGGGAQGVIYIRYPVTQ
jgi:hypothetical protein